MSFLIPANETQMEYIKKENVYRSNAQLEEDITQLIEWLSKQPHLPNVTDRKWLLHFIIGCKFSLERSKQVIELYFIARTEFPEFFDSFTKQEFDNCAKFVRLCIFPKLTPKGYRVYYARCLPTTDEDAFEVKQVLKWCTTLLHLILKEEPMYGHIFLYDLQHFRLFDFLTFTPTMMKNFMKSIIHAFPLRMKSAHIVNPPSFIGRLLTFFKMFLPNKLKQRIFVHNSLEELYQYIPKDVLPEIYGGTAGNIEQFEDYATDLYENNIDWLEVQPKADLSKRPKCVESEELSMNGTFKQIQFD